MARTSSVRVPVALCLFAMGCAGSEPVALGRDSGVSEDDAGAPSDAGSGSGGLPLDAGIGDPMDVCDPVDQTGCIEPESKCVVENPRPGGGTSCVAPGAEVGIGERCRGRDCAAGLACVATSSTSASCVQVCNFRDGTGCEDLGSDHDCRRRITGTAWGACTELASVCSVPTQDPCSGSEACQPYLRRNGSWELRCRPEGSTGEDEACGTSAGGAVCGRGLVCVQDGASGGAVCRRYCDADEDCAAPDRCLGTVTAPRFSFCTR